MFPAPGRRKRIGHWLNAIKVCPSNRLVEDTMVVGKFSLKCTSQAQIGSSGVDSEQIIHGDDRKRVRSRVWIAIEWAD